MAIKLVETNEVSNAQILTKTIKIFLPLETALGSYWLVWYVAQFPSFSFSDVYKVLNLVFKRRRKIRKLVEMCYIQITFLK